MKSAILFSLLTAATAPAQTQCQIYLATQAGSSQGLTLSLEGTADSTGLCPLSSVVLKLAVGDGNTFTHVNTPAQSWQTGVTYTAKAVISPGPPSTIQLFLNNQSIKTTQANSAFAGNPILWVAGRDGAGGNNTDWQAMGTVAVQ